MNLLKFYLKLQTAKQQTKGFTLIELLVAIAMSGIILTGLGAGMVAVLNSTSQSTAKVEVKNQLNRAIDYIHDDVKRARIAGISTEENTDDKLTLTYIASLKEGSDPKSIEYYIDDADPNEPWLGPKVLKRREEGEVDGTFGPWQVLVDGLTDDAINSNDFSCAGDATALSIGGFQACVEQRTASNGSPLYRTTVALFGKIGRQQVSVNTDSISRSVTPTLDPPELTFEPATDLTPELQWRPTLGADTYKIYKCSTADAQCDPDESDTLLGTISSSAIPLTITDETKIGGQRSCYRGKSFSGSQESDWGEPTICTLIAPSEIPAPISTLDASDIIQPIVTWTRDPNAVQYLLYRCATNDLSSPCDVDPANTTTTKLVDTITATTDAEFADYIPWNEAIVMGETPNEGEAFCYGVISKNDLGLSAMSNVNCGDINAPLPINTDWIVGFTNFNPALEIPQNLEWNIVTDAPSYEIRRCQTIETTCDPSTAGTTVLNAPLADLDPASFTGVDRPDPGTRFCYAIRAKSDTQASVFSTPPSCGTARPPECVLNLDQLGFGSSFNYKSTATASERDALKAIVTGANFVTPSTENIAKSGFSQVLHTIQENSTGTYLDIHTGANQRVLPCTTDIKMTWYYEINTLVNPSLSVTNTVRPDISWLTVTGATKYEIYWCAAVGTATCTITDDNYKTAVTAPSLSYSEKSNPSSGRRWCYAVKAVKTTGTTNEYSDFSDTRCGAVRP